MTWALDEEREKRRTLAIAATVGAASLVAVLVVVVALRSGGASSDGATGGEGPGGQAPTGDQALTVDSVEWREFAGARVPRSSAGPRDTRGNRATGFARSEAGAVLAASNIIYRAGSGAGPDIFRSTIAEQVVGPDKDRLLSNIEREHMQAKASGEPDPLSPEGVALTKGSRSGVWGYRVDSFTPDAANVNVLLRSVPAGVITYVNLGLTVRWVDGDWRLVAPLNGQWASVSRTVPSVPAGYVVLDRE